jgi:pimeloyl-ACP methyl ester carboxylesterase/DNA-binding CsgD family transcriptional regulator
MDPPVVQYATARDGVRIAYAALGGGRPLVFMPPAWSHFSRWWNTPIRALWEALARRYRLILYDARGQGSSERGLGDDHSIADYELDLEAVLDSARETHVSLLAFSVSTRVAVRYAALHPERVEALALWGAFSTPAWSSESYVTMAGLDWDTFVRNASRVGFSFVGHMVAEPIMREAVTQADWGRMVRAMARPDDADYRAKVAAPVLLFDPGSSPPFGSREEIPRNALKFANARLVPVAEPGMGIVSPDPDIEPQIALEVEAFLNQVAPHPELDRRRPDFREEEARLSSRELEVLRLVAAGMTNAEIAVDLIISPNTAAKHVASILAKTGTSNRSEATAYAVRHGLA